MPETEPHASRESQGVQLTIPNFTITRLHDLYQQYTGIQLPLNGAFKREYEWGRWMANGWTEHDLRLVVQHLRRSYKEHWLKMAKFSRLICDHASFEEWLAEARATQRNAPRPASSKIIVLREAGREPAATDKDSLTVHRADAVAQEILKAGYEKLKQELG